VRNRVRPAQLVVASEHERAPNMRAWISRSLNQAAVSPASPRHAAQMQNVLALDT
jgi:hypothetical protein